MRFVTCTAVIAAATALASPRPTLGQFSQYTQPGTAAVGQATVDEEQIEEALADARWQLGGLRLDPWLGIRNLSWNDNAGGATETADEDGGDVTASGGAGLRAYLPTGSDVVWAAYALPEYSWWAEREELRRLNGRYGAGVFGFFNRLTLQATAQRTEALEIVSSEVPEQANTREDRIEAAADLELGFAVSVFTEAATQRVRNLLEPEEREDGPPFHLLDRNEDRLRAGIRYRPRDRWTFGVGAEWTRAEFVRDERDLSNSGEAPLVEVRYRGPKFSASAEAEWRSLESEEGSGFPDTEEVTAGLQLTLEGNRLAPALYARRTLSFAITEGYSHFTTEVVGLSVGLPLGHRTELTAFAETGRNDYSAVSGELPVREDDVTSFGGSLGFRLGRSLSFQLGGYRADFDSTLPDEDRSVTILSTGLTFGLGGGDETPW